MPVIVVCCSWPGLETTNDVKEVGDDHRDGSLSRLSTHTPGKVKKFLQTTGLFDDLTVHVTFDQDRLVAQECAVVVAENPLQRLVRSRAAVDPPEQFHRLSCPKWLILKRRLLLVVARDEEDDD